MRSNLEPGPAWPPQSYQEGMRKEKKQSKKKPLMATLLTQMPWWVRLPDHRSQGFPPCWSEVTSTGFGDVIRNMFAWFAEDVAGNVQESPNTAGDEDWRSVYRGGGAAGSTYWQKGCELQWAPGHPLTASHSPSFLTLPNITDHRTQSHILFLFHLFLLDFYVTLSSAMIRLPIFLGYICI